MEGMLIGTLLREIFDILSTDPKSGLGWVDLAAYTK